MAGINLTDDVIKSLSIEKKRKITSSLEEGLTLIVYTSGTKSWSYRFKAPETNKRSEVGIGRWPHMNQEQAAEKAREYERLVERGINPSAYANKKRTHDSKIVIDFNSNSKYRIDVIAMKWLEHSEATNKKSSYDKFKSSYNCHLSKKFGQDDIRYFDKVEYEKHIFTIKRKSIENGGVGSASKSSHKAMSALFSYATEAELINANPLFSMKKIAKGTALEPRERYLLSEELHKFFNEIDDIEEVDDDIKLGMRIQLLTGLRIGEILDIKRSDINAKRRKITHANKIMKNDKKATTIMTDTLVEVIFDYIIANDIKENSRLFRKNLGVTEFGREVKKLEHWIKFRTHDLRRTVRTNLQYLGCPAEIREVITNHALPSGVASHYDQAKLDAMQLKYLHKLAKKYKKVKKNKNALNFEVGIEDDNPIISKYADYI